MEPTANTLHPVTAGFGFSAAVAIIFNTVLVLVKETYPAVKALLKALSGHHWTTHGIIVILVFIVCGLIFSRISSLNRIRATTLTAILLVSTVFAGFGIAGFFLFE